MMNKTLKVATVPFLLILLLASCSQDPSGPWFSVSDPTQYVLTLGHDAEQYTDNSDFFQVAKLEHNIYVVEAYRGTWTVDESARELTISVAQRWNGIEYSTTTGGFLGTDWVDDPATWTWTYEKRGDTLTVTPHAGFNGGEAIELTESDNIVHFLNVIGM